MSVLVGLSIGLYIVAAICTGVAVVKYDGLRLNAAEVGYEFTMGVIFAPIIWVGYLIKKLLKD